MVFFSLSSIQSRDSYGLLSLSSIQSRDSYGLLLSLKYSVTR